MVLYNMKRYKPDRKFQELAAQVNKALQDNDGLIGDQKAQVEELMRLEYKFRQQIKRYKQTHNIYIKFVSYIVDELDNILKAQSFFREKREVFNQKISSAIRNSDTTLLLSFNINFPMVNFIVNNWSGTLPNDISDTFQQLKETRRILIENNLPLAINRAKLFHRKNSNTELTLLDLINICSMGLTVGVDKYVGDYTKVWRSVSIGRMVGYMIEECSYTFLKMSPNDKKILYRTNSLRSRLKIEDIDELAAAVNQSFIEDGENGKKIPRLPITEMQIRNLLNGSSHLSINIYEDQDDDSGTSTLYDCTPTPDQDVEEIVSRKQILDKITEGSDELTMIEKKIIRLKGVEI